MRKLLFFATAITTFVGILFASNIPPNHIVSTAWLQKHLNDKDIVIIDTRSPKLYKHSHIKNSINLPKKIWFKGYIGDIPKLYDTPKQAEEIFQKAGIDKDKTLIFYSAGDKNKDFADAASAFFVAWIYGLKKSAILNGGYTKWISEKKEVTSKIPKIAPSEFEVDSVDNSPIASLSDIIKAIYDEDIQITDARTAKFYRGEDNKKELKKHGRIPTAKLTPLIRQVKKEGDYFLFLSKKDSRKILHNGGYGIELNKPLIIYCNTGHKARGLWFVTKFIDGLRDVRVYDGSMVQYSRTAMPVESGEPMD